MSIASGHLGFTFIYFQPHRRPESRAFLMALPNYPFEENGDFKTIFPVFPKERAHSVLVVK